MQTNIPRKNPSEGYLIQLTNEVVLREWGSLGILECHGEKYVVDVAEKTIVILLFLSRELKKALVENSLALDRTIEYSKEYLRKALPTN